MQSSGPLPRRIALTAKPGGGSLQAASPASPPRPNGQEPATTEQALIGSKWRIGNWEMHFQKDHVIIVDEGGSPLRIWHWWVIESRKVHIQYAAEPAVFDTSKGADVTFDPGFTTFAGGKTGEVKGTRASTPAIPATCGGHERHTLANLRRARSRRGLPFRQNWRTSYPPTLGVGQRWGTIIRRP